MTYFWQCKKSFSSNLKVWIVHLSNRDQQEDQLHRIMLNLQDGYRYLSGNSKNVKGNMLRDRKISLLLLLRWITFCLWTPFLLKLRSHDWWLKHSMVIFCNRTSLWGFSSEILTWRTCYLVVCYRIQAQFYWDHLMSHSSNRKVLCVLGASWAAWRPGCGRVCNLLFCQQSDWWPSVIDRRHQSGHSVSTLLSSLLPHTLIRTSSFTFSLLLSLFHCWPCLSTSRFLHLAWCLGSISSKQLLIVSFFLSVTLLFFQPAVISLPTLSHMLIRSSLSKREIFQLPVSTLLAWRVVISPRHSKHDILTLFFLPYPFGVFEVNQWPLFKCCCRTFGWGWFQQGYLHHSLKQNAHDELITLKQERMFFRHFFTHEHLPAISSHLLFNAQRIWLRFHLILSYPVKTSH